jgi:hypothetical protein
MDDETDRNRLGDNNFGFLELVLDSGAVTVSMRRV